jgi:hypothetical protein
MGQKLPNRLLRPMSGLPPGSDRTADIAGGPVRANTGSGGLYFKLGVPRMSAREPTSLITIVITAACKCPTFTMICAYLRPMPAGQGSANDRSVP